MPAFVRALELNVDGFESDLRLTRDGQVVLIHDAVRLHLLLLLLLNPKRSEVALKASNVLSCFFFGGGLPSSLICIPQHECTL